MENSEKVNSAEKYRGWPVVFNVCEDHKREFFADYKNAEVRDKKHCVLCHTEDNDSLGG